MQFQGTLLEIYTLKNKQRGNPMPAAKALQPSTNKGLTFDYSFDSSINQLQRLLLVLGRAIPYVRAVLDIRVSSILLVH